MQQWRGHKHTTAKSSTTLVPVHRLFGLPQRNKRKAEGGTVGMGVMHPVAIMQPSPPPQPSPVEGEGVLLQCQSKRPYNTKLEVLDFDSHWQCLFALVVFESICM